MESLENPLKSKLVQLQLMAVRNEDAAGLGINEPLMDIFQLMESSRLLEHN
jgi:hypothetical protein